MMRGDAPSDAAPVVAADPAAAVVSVDPAAAPAAAAADLPATAGELACFPC
jgi:hypothetical protein